MLHRYIYIYHMYIHIIYVYTRKSYVLCVSHRNKKPTNQLSYAKHFASAPTELTSSPRYKQSSDASRSYKNRAGWKDWEGTQQQGPSSQCLVILLKQFCADNPSIRIIKSVLQFGSDLNFVYVMSSRAWNMLAVCGCKQYKSMLNLSENCE